MDEAQEIASQTTKFIVAKHRFESASKKPGCMICFFEGVHDKDYYNVHIRSFCGDFIGIPCHCKKNVLKMYEEIHADNKDKYRLAYFIDRDFDELINNPDIFETDGYSIENYYCTRSSFSRILKDYLYLDDSSDDYSRAIVFYDREYSSSHSVTSEFNYYYSAVKRKERNTGEEISVSCGDCFPLNLGSIGINNYSKKYDLTTLNETFGTNLIQDDLKAEQVHLDVDPCLFYRGKYEIQELESILEYLIKEASGSYRNIPKTERIIRKNPQMACIQAGKLLLVLAPMADVTDNLRRYLKNFESN